MAHRPAGSSKGTLPYLLIGAGLACAVVAAGLLFGPLAAVNRLPGVTGWLATTLQDLRSSTFFFGLDLVAFIYTLSRLRRALQEGAESEARYWSRFNLITVSVFFGIGVIYTAIGIQGALRSALGSLGPGATEPGSSWTIFEQLVSGGILTALTTTIVGGAGGFGLRLIRHLSIGRLQG